MSRYISIFLIAVWATIPAGLHAQDRETVAVIGTGDMGDSIGPKLVEMGYRVVYGSRNPESKSVQNLVRITGTEASATTQQKAAQGADIVVLAVPWPAMEKVAQNLGTLDGKIVIDVSTPTRQAEDGYLESLVETSSAEMIQTWNPKARVVKTLLAGSYVIDDPMTLGSRVASYIAADDREAKEKVARIVAKLGIQPVDAGPLRHAREIEAWARLWFVPAIQKRKTGHELSVIPSNYWYCIWDDSWYEPVSDSDELADIPELQTAPEACPSD